MLIFATKITTINENLRHTRRQKVTMASEPPATYGNWNASLNAPSHIDRGKGPPIIQNGHPAALPTAHGSCTCS